MHLVRAKSSANRLGIGAIIFAIFGGIWLEQWANHTAASWLSHVVIAAFSLGLASIAYRRYRRNKPKQPETNAESKKRSRTFHFVNAAQWIAIPVLVNVLEHFGMEKWVTPMATIIVGLHFIPLGYTFRNPSLFVTASAFIAFALMYPNIAPGGPTDPVGFLVPGLVLWLSAAWALRPVAGSSSLPN